MSDMNSNTGLPKHFSQQNEAQLLLSLQEFNVQLPTEEAAREDVKIRLEKENLLYCHDCGKRNLEKKYGARVLKCLDCGHKTWVTAGTFFHHAKRVRPRLAAIWLMEHGFVFGSSKLHKLVNITQSAAFNILKKIAIVIEAQLERDVCEIPSSVFRKVICKRSKETPARTHPVAEQDEIEALGLQDSINGRDDTNEQGCAANGQGYAANEQDNISSQLSQQEKVLYDLLSENPVSFEELYVRSAMGVPEVSATLVILEIGGLISSLPGNNYIRCPNNKNLDKTAKSNGGDVTLAKFEAMALAVQDFVRNGFHGISRKYLQYYLFLYWYYVGTSHWERDSLLNACLRFRSIKWTEIINYVTPVMVKWDQNVAIYGEG